MIIRQRQQRNSRWWPHEYYFFFFHYINEWAFFYASYNGLRHLVDGNLKVWLFGHSEVSLKGHFCYDVGDEELWEIIGTTVKRKKASYVRMLKFATHDNH